MNFWEHVLLSEVDSTTGYTMHVAKMTLGHNCGYVEIPKGHCCYKASYFDSPLKDLTVHGEVTFSEFVPAKETGKPAVWIVGFDCGHYGDFVPNLKWGNPDKYRDMWWVLDESKKLAKQLHILDKRSKLRKMPVRLSVRCPECLDACFFPHGTKADDLEGATTTCSHCKKELIIKDQHAVSLHEWLHAGDTRWPKDGKHTGRMDIPDNS